jgi:ABC-type phosphate transport system permease subunit
LATIMIAGNAAEIPRALLAPVRTLTSNVALEMSYATGEHREALFATGVVLFVIIMVLNTVANATSAKRRKQP